MLAPFIKYLEKNNLVEFDILEDTEECLQNRLKIQKYAFLAKHFGLDLPFKHEIYLYGPYSTSLTEKFYELAENPELYDATEQLQTSFQSQDFLGLVQGKDLDWLETATTMMARNKDIKERDALVENIEYIKGGFSQEFITDVLVDLEDRNLLKLYD